MKILKMFFLSHHSHPPLGNSRQSLSPDPRLHSLNSLVTAFSNSKAFDAHTEKRLKGRKNVANSEAKSERQFVYVSDEISADFPLKIFFYSRCCTTSTTMENMKMGKKCEVRKNQQRIFAVSCMLHMFEIYRVECSHTSEERRRRLWMGKLCNAICFHFHYSPASCVSSVSVSMERELTGDFVWTQEDYCYSLSSFNVLSFTSPPREWIVNIFT